MKNFWQQRKKPILVLAPMAGITDQPFRLICKKFGAEVLFSEMVSSEAIFYNNLESKILNLKSTTKNLKLTNSYQLKANSLLKTLDLIKFSKMERPFVVQIFGADPAKMAFAGEYIASGKWFKDYKKISFQTTLGLGLPSTIGDRGQKSKFKSQNYNSKVKNDFNIFKIKNLKFKIMSIPSGIDINMGCPARDVTKIGAGAALMKNPELVVQIIKNIKKHVNLPVSVKTRLGWNDATDILTFCRMLECAGVDALIIHARTYRQFFSGQPNWQMVYKVKKLVKIPVILNGGIETLEDYQRIDLSRVDGAAIARGAWGHPWIFQEIQNLNLKAKSQPLTANLDFIKKTMLEHANLTYQLKGEQGIKELRKHLAWYWRGLPRSHKIKKKLVKVSSLEEIKEILNSYPG